MVHLNGGINRLEQALFIDAGEDKAGFVERLRTFSGSADANSRERFADTREEGAFLGESTAVGHDRESVHLQTVVVMEA